MIIIAALIYFLQLYNFVLLIRVLMSWIPLDRSNPTIDGIVRFIYDITEPVLAPVRGVLPQGMGIDFSPLVVFFGISFVTRMLATLA